MNFKIKELNNKQIKIYDDLINQGYRPIVAKILALRDYSKAEKLIHYNLLSEIDIAVDYLFDAIKNKKKMCIVADYDVDGATSCSIMYKGLEGLSADISYFVPNRFEHGYGLQESVINDMLKSFPDTNVIITVDNGIASIAGVDYANSKNIDVVVTDHHLEGNDRPNAICIVNPNQKKCEFPSKALAGCGVAFYTITALYDKFIKESVSVNSFKPIQLVDYLAIGTVADVVSLDENNRLIVNMGLKQIHKGKANVGVRALLEVLEIPEDKLTSVDIGFRIGPVLNAAGRLQDMSKGINLLLETNYEVALKKAVDLLGINKARKDIEKNMKEEALSTLEENLSKGTTEKNNYSCIVANENFHEGIIGIVASRIKDLVYLPTIVFADGEEGQLKGSGRSVEGLNLKDALDYVYKLHPESMARFGGHAMAAGVTIYKDKLDVFQSAFNDACAEMFNYIPPVKIEEVDEELDISSVSLKDAEELSKQVWGQHFKEPLFYAKFKITKQRLVGNGQHLSLELMNNGAEIKAMYFFKKEELNESNEIEALFKLNINEFRNKRSVQLFISDAKNILRDENGKIISKNKKKQEQYDEMNQDNQYDDSNQDVYVDK